MILLKMKKEKRKKDCIKDMTRKFYFHNLVKFKEKIEANN